MEGQEHQPAEGQAEPELLYHFTTLDGFLGIIRNSELWATDIRYLNDTSEFRTVPDLAAENLIEAMDLEGQNSELIDSYRPLFVQAGRPLYVASFSAEVSGDDLSQWRAYGGHHSGICLGFSPGYLRRIGMQFLNESSDSGWVRTSEFNDPLIQCEYLDHKNAVDKNAISPNIKYLVDYARENGPIAGMAFAMYSAGLKHKGFHAEREWRLVLVRDCEAPSNRLHFRGSRSLIIPYACIPLKMSEEPIAIERIVLGPTPHEDMAKNLWR
jgi:hypothetical protein